MRRTRRGGVYARGRCIGQKKTLAQDTCRVSGIFFTHDETRAYELHQEAAQTRPHLQARGSLGGWICLRLRLPVSVVKGSDPSADSVPGQRRGRQQEVFLHRVLWHNGCILGCVLDGHAGCDTWWANQF
jgi:hypothetical protein